MLRPESQVQVWLYTPPVDMRKSIDGLAALVEKDMALSPMMCALFVFCNKRRDKIKLLYWERNGFVLWYKRLEKQRFRWLKPDENETLTVTGADLNRLLDGLDIFYQKPHKSLYYNDIT